MLGAGRVVVGEPVGDRARHGGPAGHGVQVRVRARVRVEVLTC